MIRSFAALAVAFVALLATAANALTLITEEELARAKGSAQPIPQTFVLIPNSGGPRIEILSPTLKAEQRPVVPKPFPLRVRFIGQDGAEVAMKTLRVVYLAFFNLDITDRLLPYVRENQIAVDDADIPVGEHSIRIEIADDRGRPSREVISFVVRQ